MIVVKIRENSLIIDGHAGYEEKGKDIVCAGVDALTQTLVKSIEDLTEDKIEYDISPGRADIKVWESFRESKNSGGFLFHWHMHDCG